MRTNTRTTVWRCIGVRRASDGVIGNCRVEAHGLVEAWIRTGLTADLAGALLEKKSEKKRKNFGSEDELLRAWRRAVDPAAAAREEAEEAAAAAAAAAASATADADGAEDREPKRARRTARATAGRHRDREETKALEKAAAARDDGGDAARAGPKGVAYRLGRESCGAPKGVRLGLSPLVGRPDRVYAADYGEDRRGPSLLHGALHAWEAKRLEALSLEGELRRLDALLATEKRNADAICDVLAACEPGHQKAHDRLADLEADYATLDDTPEEAEAEEKADADA